jgi:GTPase SAR1 family protein
VFLRGLLVPDGRSLSKLASDLVEILQESGDEAMLGLGRLLHQRIAEPRAYLTLIGETSSGKTTLLNGLFDAALMPTGVAPTTGVVVQIIAEAVSPPQLLAINRDGTQEPLRRQEFEKLVREPDADLLRLQVRAQPQRGVEDGLVLFDTPGFNSVIGEHEEVLRRFVPEADVVVFVSSYRSGFSQVDQDLFETVRDATGDASDLPFLLVVNRVPVGRDASDKRVLEIQRNANDSMLRELSPILVFEEPRPEGGKPLPRARALWNEVERVARSPERLAAVRAKLRDGLLSLAEEAACEIERQVLSARMDEGERDALGAMGASLHDARTESLNAVARCTARLETLIPPTLKSERRRVGKKLRAQIERSGKWFGKDECVAWVQHHSLPYECRQTSLEIERLIEDQLDRLNRELEDIANTAIQTIEGHARMRGDAVHSFAVSLGRSLSMRLGGAAANSLLSGLGGVGGAAAGAGNLVKMIVKRVGLMFNKTFGRQVYNQIGRTFTKKLLQRATVVLMVVVEGVALWRDANRWRSQLADKVDEALKKWAAEVEEDLLGQHLPGLEEANRDGVLLIYDELLDELDAQRKPEAEDEHQLKERSGLLERVRAIQARLESPA